MKRKRRVFGGAFRAKVALAAVKGDKTLSELASQFEVHANQVSAWRKELIERAAELFEDGRRQRRDEEVSTEELYELQRLVELYTFWDKPDEAAKWREKLTAIQAEWTKAVPPPN